MTEIEGEKENQLKACPECGRDIPIAARFCRYCGTPQPAAEISTVSGRRKQVLIISAFFLLTLVLCSIIRFAGGVDSYKEIILLDGVLAGITVFFVLLGWKNVGPALSLKGFSPVRAAFYILITAGFSIMVQYTMDWLNHNLFETEFYYFLAFKDSGHPLLWMFISLAAQPAIFEELGYRGLIQGSLTNILTKPQALSITAFAFAIIHLSIISIIWLIPFALLLGYVRMRENTIWYGVLMHFVFNSIAVLNDLPEYSNY